MSYFPIFTDITHKDCLIIGGGKTALRKAEVLCEFEADVTLIAPEVCDEILRMHECEKIKYINRTYMESDLNGRFLVVVAIDDPALSNEIAGRCREKNIPVNAVDRKEDCTFIFPSYRKKGELVAAFSSGGSSPIVTQYMAGKSDEFLTDMLAETAEFLGSLRGRIKSELDSYESRKDFYKKVFNECVNLQKIPDENRIAELIRELKAEEK